MVKVAIHQPAFIPWFPFFYKMAQSDFFVLLEHCQFEKNGYQNRCEVRGKWWTLPVKSGLVPLKDKECVNGQTLVGVNYLWIMAIAQTLGIPSTKVVFDFETEKKGTERLIEICKTYVATHYLTNPQAQEKYLDRSAFERERIEILACHPPKQYQRPIFEMFEAYGIEGTAKLLKKDLPGCKI